MTFKVYIVNTDGETIQEIGDMSITDAKEFIAMIQEVEIVEDYEYNQHRFSVEGKSFFIEVL